MLRKLTFRLASGAEAALVIALAAREATVRLIASFFRRSARDPSDADPGTHDTKEEVRLKLDRRLAMSLEFALAADILRTAVAPTWDEIGKSVAIAMLRTALNFFLQHEIDGASARQARSATGRLVAAPADLLSIVTAAALIEFAGAVIIEAATVRALLALAGRGGIEQARLVAIAGSLSALGNKSAATLLKAVALGGWRGIGAFAAIFALRTLIKQFLTLERRRIA